MRTRLELKGAKQLNAKLEALGEDLAAKAGRGAVYTAARGLRDELKATAPYAAGTRMRDGRDYGHLRDNIRIRREKERKAYTIRYVVHFGRAFWAYFREVGTAKQPARPWAVPTFARMQQQLLDLMLDTLAKRADAAARRLARQKKPSRIGHNGGPPLED